MTHGLAKVIDVDPPFQERQTRKYDPSRLSFRCTDPVSFEIKPNAMSSFLAPFAARSDTFIISEIHDAFTVPTPLTSPVSRLIDIPRAMYASTVFPRTALFDRARNRST